MSQTGLTTGRNTRAEIQRVPFGTPPTEIRAIVLRDGGVILGNVISREEVAQINKELDPHFNKISQGNFGKGENNFLADFMGHKTKRMVHCVKHSKSFRETMLASPVLAEYIAALVPGAPGTHSMGSSQGIEIQPGEKAQALHRDASTHLQLLQRVGPDGPEILVNALLALTDITEEMGATRVIPGSHLWEDFSALAGPSETVPAVMNAGDVLLISGRVLHGGGANSTTDRTRRIVSTAFNIPFFIGEEAWPFAISVEEARTYPKQVQAFLGFRSVSFGGEEPGFLWRTNMTPLEESLAL